MSDTSVDTGVRTDARGEAPARPAAPTAIARVKPLVEPALRAAVDGVADDRMRRIAGYQLGWWDADGQATDSGGKAIRPVLAVLAAEAVSGRPADGVPAAVAVELVHNFSLLHDDIMDRDVERRHRPTGWVAFGEGQAILAGNAMLTAAVDVLVEHSPAAVPQLLATVQHLISGQSADLALEQRDDATLDEVIDMEGGKTAALISGSLALGALGAGAPAAVVERLAEFGRLVGVAFQLVDDLLGIVGDPGVTGKSASSDVRAGKRSAPVVAALRSRTAAGAALGDLLVSGPPETDDDVARAVRLITDAGGVRWAADEARRLLDAALVELDAAALGRGDDPAGTAAPSGPLSDPPAGLRSVAGAAVDDLRELAAFLVHRVW